MPVGTAFSRYLLKQQTVHASDVFFLPKEYKRSNMLTMSREQRTEVIQTALGKVKADVVLAGGQLVNVYSGEILPDVWVAVKGNRVAYVGIPHLELVDDDTTIYELEGRFLLPGFIDGHTHLDSIFQVRDYAEYALAYGNTTAVSEVAMIANAM